MVSDLDYKSIYTFLTTLAIILVFFSGCITDSDIPQLCNKTGCHSITTPQDAFSFFELNADYTKNERKMAQIFSKNITANFSSFSEDLNVARQSHAPIDNHGTNYGTGTSILMNNNTCTLINARIHYPSGEYVTRDVPFVYEEGIWRIDMSPKYL